jgi:hypothetical protein
MCYWQLVGGSIHTDETQHNIKNKLPCLRQGKEIYSRKLNTELLKKYLDISSKIHIKK